MRGNDGRKGLGNQGEAAPQKNRRQEPSFSNFACASPNIPRGSPRQHPVHRVFFSSTPTSAALLCSALHGSDCSSPSSSSLRLSQALCGIAAVTINSDRAELISITSYCTQHNSPFRPCTPKLSCPLWRSSALQLVSYRPLISIVQLLLNVPCHLHVVDGICRHVVKCTN